MRANSQPLRHTHKTLAHVCTHIRRRAHACTPTDEAASQGTVALATRVVSVVSALIVTFSLSLCYVLLHVWSKYQKRQSNKRYFELFKKNLKRFLFSFCTKSPAQFTFTLFGSHIFIHFLFEFLLHWEEKKTLLHAHHFKESYHFKGKWFQASRPSDLHVLEVREEIGCRRKQRTHLRWLCYSRGNSIKT